MSYTEREALEYLTSLGDTDIIDIKDKTYSTKKIYQVTDPLPAPLTVTTLTSLVDYIKSNFDAKISENLLIQVKSPQKIVLYSELREDDAERAAYIVCDALLPSNIVFDHFIGTEQFNIMLQSSFEDTDDKDIILKVIGNIQEESVKTTGDDGVSQVVTAKTGVAQVGNVKVPNPVVLAPYRTFSEVMQPESKFIFRMQEGPRCALFEADGGAWRNEAMDNIKIWLKNQLEENQNIKIIS